MLLFAFALLLVLAQLTLNEWLRARYRDLTQLGHAAGMMSLSAVMFTKKEQASN